MDYCSEAIMPTPFGSDSHRTDGPFTNSTDIVQALSRGDQHEPGVGIAQEGTAGEFMAVGIQIIDFEHGILKLRHRA